MAKPRLERNFLATICSFGDNFSKFVASSATLILGAAGALTLQSPFIRPSLTLLIAASASFPVLPAALSPSLWPYPKGPNLVWIASGSAAKGNFVIGDRSNADRSDLNNDGIIDGSDLTVFAFGFGKTVTTQICSDNTVYGQCSVDKPKYCLLVL